MEEAPEAKIQFEEYGTNHYRVTGSDTRVDPHLFLDDRLLEAVRSQDDLSLKQLRDAASLPGVRYVAGMPDIHQGYGVPVGCVMAMDATEGLISAGAVGMDINCGVRLLRTDLPVDSLDAEELKVLGRAVLRRMPVGIGTNGPYRDALQSRTEKILLEGVKALEGTRFIRNQDPERIQDHGTYKGARLEPVTSRAWERLDQFGTLGGGNHFLELVEINEPNEPDTAKRYGLGAGKLGFVIHTGSRGFGHQICVDYSDRMMERSEKFDLTFPTKELASAPIQSDLGKDYFSCMAAAANVAYVNRQIITYSIREACEEVFNNRSANVSPEVVYDITHNLARFETIGDEEYLIHRKGAVRALPPNHPEIPHEYENIGHPVMVPGNMATGTYVMRAGGDIENSFYSLNHGAGRQMSRTQAKEEISESMFLNAMEDVQLLGASRTSIRDEAPQAYKRIHNVIDVLVEAGIARNVAHLQPLVVIKGD